MISIWFVIPIIWQVQCLKHYLVNGRDTIIRGCYTNALLLIVNHVKFKYGSKKLKYKHYAGSFGVDIGTVVICDINNYPKQTKLKDKWINNVFDVANKKQAGSIPSGYVSATGWGDGVYEYAIGTINGKLLKSLYTLFNQNKSNVFSYTYFTDISLLTIVVVKLFSCIPSLVSLNVMFLTLDVLSILSLFKQDTTL